MRPRYNRLATYDLLLAAVDPPPLANGVSALSLKDSEKKHILDAMLWAVNTSLPLSDCGAVCLLARRVEMTKMKLQGNWP